MKQPTYIRQRYLLEFIAALPDKGISRTNLQKLVFLDEQYSGIFYYDFVPYKYGPYSFLLDNDIDVLCNHFYIRKNMQKIYIDGFIPSKNLSLLVASERGDDLLRKTYREYPYYAINSTILNKLFKASEVQGIFNGNKYIINSSDDVLFTIGYEGKSLEAFINILLQNRINLLCDVRKNPFSRKFGFSQSKLKTILPKVGIKYINISALGIESEKRIFLNNIEDYKNLFLDYEKSLPYKMEYIEMLYELFLHEHRIALMCYEKSPEMCHRNIISKYLVKMYNVKTINL
ncbi:MAG: DUF488 family protein [Synergistaceae bacterium]|nr:DUF488 family protein [Synergistaceae bacterium]